MYKYVNICKSIKYRNIDNKYRIIDNNEICFMRQYFILYDRGLDVFCDYNGDALPGLHSSETKCRHIQYLVFIATTKEFVEKVIFLYI